MPQLVEDAEQILGYRFGNRALLEEALTHASKADHRLQSNERMEFLGDAVLGLVVCEHLYARFPELFEGDLTKMKSAVVSRRACAEVSERIGLCTMLNLGKGMSTRRELPHSVAAAVLESIIAAIYLDGGMEPVKRFILEHMRPLIDGAAESAHQENFKSVLQQHAQRQLPDPPIYILLDAKGPDHAKAFQVCVELDGRRFGSAWANSKKEAEQKAALLALDELGLARIDDEGAVLLIEADVEG